VKLPAVVRRPILGGLAAYSVNHSAPSGPAAISCGPLGLVGIGYSVIAPEVVIRPILWPFSSVNQSAPSGPTVMPAGWLTGVGTSYSVTPQALAGSSSAAIKTPCNSRTGDHRSRPPGPSPLPPCTPSMATNFRVDPAPYLRQRRPYPPGTCGIKGSAERARRLPGTRDG